jgi:thiamine biosynthesis lipoprotein ApbE
MMLLAALLSLGEEYLTREQALALVFPGSPRILERAAELDEATRLKVEERYGGAVETRPQVYLAVREGRLEGYALILSEVTKTLRAEFIVAIDPAGEVSQVAVLSHEDHIGGDCRRQRFVDQFRGKTVSNRVSVPNGGILPVSGATLSCQAVARAVRKALAVVQFHYLDRPEHRAAALQEEPVRQKRYLMGTFLTITSHGPAAAVEEAFEEVKRLEKVLSNYDDKSELSRLNREGSLEASDDLLDFVRLSKRWSEESGGAFDVTVAPLVRLWGFKDGRHRVPSDAELSAGLGSVGSQRIRIDGRTVRLDPGTELDPGAIGKGMAVDRAAAVLRKEGVKRALVDFGSSAAALGSWELAIRDPFDAGRTLGTVSLEDETLSTSGSYEKCFEKDGKTYTHLLDPRTGRPVEDVVSVSVVAPTGAESDARATAVFVQRKLPERGAVLLVGTRGRAAMTDAWAKKFRKRGD